MTGNGAKMGWGTSTGESDKAVLVHLDDLDEEVWIPKSQIHDDSEVWKSHQSGQVVVTNWYAEQKGWI